MLNFSTFEVFVRTSMNFSTLASFQTTRLLVRDSHKKAKHRQSKRLVLSVIYTLYVFIYFDDIN